jgi:hypothetical protein
MIVSLGRFYVTPASQFSEFLRVVAKGIGHMMSTSMTTRKSSSAVVFWIGDRTRSPKNGEQLQLDTVVRPTPRIRHIVANPCETLPRTMPMSDRELPPT